MNNKTAALQDLPHSGDQIQSPFSRLFRNKNNVGVALAPLVGHSPLILHNFAVNKGHICPFPLMNFEKIQDFRCTKFIWHLLEKSGLIIQIAFLISFEVRKLLVFDVARSALLQSLEQKESLHWQSCTGIEKKSSFLWNKSRNQN